MKDPNRKKNNQCLLFKNETYHPDADLLWWFFYLTRGDGVTHRFRVNWDHKDGKKPDQMIKIPPEGENLSHLSGSVWFGLGRF